MKKVLYLIVSVIMVLNLFMISASAATISTLNAAINKTTKIVTVTGTIDSGAGKQVTLKITDPSTPPNVDYVSQTQSLAGGAFTFTYTLINTLQGTYTVEVGGEEVGVSHTTTFVYDITPPAVPIITTPPQAVNADSIIITGTAEADSTVKIAGGAALASGTAVGGNYSISVNLTQDAVNNLSVTATDAYDNTSGAALVAITEDSTGPAAPVVNPMGGTYNAAQNVVLTPAADAVNTYYTLDGSEPSNASAAYVGAILVDGVHGASVVLKAVSYDAVGNKGTVAAQTYVFDKQGPAAPAVNPVGGTYNAAQNVALTPAADAVNTYYTLDGSEPSNASAAYVGAIPVDGVHGASVVLKAVSYDAVGNKGTVATETYVFDKAAPLYAATYPKAGAVGVTTAEVLFKTNENGRAYLLCLADGSAAPTEVQVKAGLSAALTADTEASLVALGLTANTSYDIYVLSEDSVGNMTAVNKIDVTTLRKFNITTGLRVGASEPATVLQAGQNLTTTITATNNQTVAQWSMLIVALYTPNGSMENWAYASKQVAPGASEILNAGFKLPADITGYSVRTFVWDGQRIDLSSMEPLSNVIAIP